MTQQFGEDKSQNDSILKSKTWLDIHSKSKMYKQSQNISKQKIELEIM